MLGKFFSWQSPKTRISLGLISITICLSIFASYLGFFPDRYGAVLAGRAAIAEVVAVNSTVFITRNDIRRMEANLNILVSRNDQILSAAVRDTSGKAVALIGDHDLNWQAMEQGFSTESQLVVPIWEGETEWGQIELRFQALKRTDFFAFFFEPLTQFILFLSFFSFIFYQFYLGKMLKQLDPSQAIPDRVRSALDTMAEGLLVLDAKQNIVLANEAFSELVKERPEKLMGRNVGRFPWEKVNDKTEKLLGMPEIDTYPWEKAIATGSLQMNHMLRLKIDEDKIHTFMVNCSPVLGPKAQTVGVMVSFDDITELEAKEVELRRSKDEAEAANKAKSEFLANMSHEIRTPMNAILGFTEVLIRGYTSNPTDSKRYLNTISSSGKHLLELINDILDLSKVEAGRVEVETLATPIHQVIHEVVKIMSVKATEKNIDLEFIALDSMPNEVITDPARVRQILTNLIGNAIKFTEQGSVKITAQYQAGIHPENLRIEVSDTGIGMTQAQAEAVFNPFVQADSSITRRFGGTGLGLTISKRFAEALGGDITVRSEAGKGSTFIVTIPAVAADGSLMLGPDAVMADVLHDSKIKECVWLFPASRVLVVDDGQENRELLEVVLADVGLEVETAVDGKDGLDKALSGSYDIILMDVQMPEMDGYTSVRLMRDGGIKIPVYALTAHAMKGAEEECLQAGYSGYMPKPIDIDLLLNKLAEELGGRAVETTPDTAKDQLVPLLSTEVDASKEPATEEHSAKSEIHSSLALGTDKFQKLIDRFIVRLKVKQQEMHASIEAKNYEELENLAHWLKGSAGSIGFHDFTDPAAELENSAKLKEHQSIEKVMVEIDTLIGSISAGSGYEEEFSEKELVADHASENSLITSSLLLSSPKLKPMIEKFIIRLSDKIVEMESANTNQQFKELADLAHWLKGSAGSLGFHDFTLPASELEDAALKDNVEATHYWLEIIKEMAIKIDISN